MIFAYSSIVWKYSKNQAKKEMSPQDQTSTDKKSQDEGLPATRKPTTRTLTDNERKLILKAVVISATFIAGWLPEFVKIICEMVTASKVKNEVQITVDLLITINPILNAIVLFQLDAKVRTNLLELFPFLHRFTDIPQRMHHSIQRWRPAAANNKHLGGPAIQTGGYRIAMRPLNLSPRDNHDASTVKVETSLLFGNFDSPAVRMSPGRINIPAAPVHNRNDLTSQSDGKRIPEVGIPRPTTANFDMDSGIMANSAQDPHLQPSSPLVHIRPDLDALLDSRIGIESRDATAESGDQIGMPAIGATSPYTARM